MNLPSEKFQPLQKQTFLSQANQHESRFISRGVYSKPADIFKFILPRSLSITSQVRPLALGHRVSAHPK
jgi:hypothetical protein